MQQDESTLGSRSYKSYDDGMGDYVGDDMIDLRGEEECKFCSCL
jgi:hypothetical protein